MIIINLNKLNFFIQFNLFYIIFLHYLNIVIYLVIKLIVLNYLFFYLTQLDFYNF